MKVKKAQKIKTFNLSETIRRMEVNSSVSFRDDECTNDVCKNTVKRIGQAEPTRIYKTTRLDGGTEVIRIR